MFQTIKRLFASPPLPDPTEGWKLDASTESRLSQSLTRLPAGERGWITFAEARSLFSTADPAYAFGESDQEGSRTITTFAEQCRSDLNFMPAEGRVYFLKRHR